MIITSVRQASASEMASEIDRRGAAIEKLEAERDGLLDALTAAEARIAGLEAALGAARKTMRNAWGAVTSDQVVDKQVGKMLQRGFEAAREALSRQEGGR